MPLVLQNSGSINTTALKHWASFKHIFHLVTTPTPPTPEHQKNLLITPRFSSHFLNPIRLHLKWQEAEVNKETEGHTCSVIPAQQKTLANTEQFYKTNCKHRDALNEQKAVRKQCVLTHLRWQICWAQKYSLSQTFWQLWFKVHCAVYLTRIFQSEGIFFPLVILW